MAMERTNLLGGPPGTYLLEDTEAADALRAGAPPAQVAARFPSYSAAWAALAVHAYAQGDAVTAYAYARTGYHRGLDLLGAAAAAIGEDDEAERCEAFLQDSSPTAAAQLAVEIPAMG
jgi:hypothetical protein